MVEREGFGEARDERLPARLVPAVAHGLAQVAVLPRVERADEQQRALEVEDRVAQRHRLRQDRRALRRLELDLRRRDDERESRPASATRPRHDPAVVELAAERQAAEQRRGGVVGMAFELGGERKPVERRAAAR